MRRSRKPKAVEAAQDTEERWLYRCAKCGRDFIRRPPMVGAVPGCPDCSSGGGFSVRLGFVRLAETADYERLGIEPTRQDR